MAVFDQYFDNRTYSAQHSTQHSAQQSIQQSTATFSLLKIARQLKHRITLSMSRFNPVNLSSNAAFAPHTPIGDAPTEAEIAQAWLWIRQRPQDSLDAPLSGYSHEDLYWRLFSLEYSKRIHYISTLSPDEPISGDLNLYLNMLYNIVQYRGTQTADYYDWEGEALYSPAEEAYWHSVAKQTTTIKGLLARFLSHNPLTNNCTTQEQSRGNPEVDKQQIQLDCLYLRTTEKMAYQHNSFPTLGPTATLLNQLFVGRSVNNADSQALQFWQSKANLAEYSLSQVAWGYYNTPEGRTKIELKLALTSGTLVSTWSLSSQQFVDSLNKIILTRDNATNQALITKLEGGCITRETAMVQFLLSDELHQETNGILAVAISK